MFCLFFSGPKSTGPAKRPARPTKGRRGDAHNSEASIIDQDLFADDAGIRREEIAPGAIAYDDRILGARRLILRRERASHRSGCAEDLKVIAGNHFTHQPVMILPVETPVGLSEATISRQAFQKSAARLKIFVLDISRPTALDAYIAQPLGLPSRRQWSEQHGVDAAENGRIRADAQRERENGQQSEAGCFREHPRAIA